MRRLSLTCLFALILLMLAESSAWAEFWARPRAKPSTPPSTTLWVPSVWVRECEPGAAFPGFDHAGNLPLTPSRPFVPLYEPGMFLYRPSPFAADTLPGHRPRDRPPR